MNKTSTILKEKIKELLNEIDEISQVEDFPVQDFDKYPAVEVSYEGNVSDYLTNSENDLIYTYKLYSFQIIEGAIDRRKARLALEELSDTISDKFDSDEFLDGVSLPANKTMIGVRPTTVGIGESEDGKFTLSQIELAIRVTKLN